MKIIARHERDARDIELVDDDEVELAGELGMPLSQLKTAGITAFTIASTGWTYRLEY